MLLKDYFLLSNECLVCGLKICSNNSNSDYRTFLNHIKRDHNLDNESYYLEYVNNGKIPKCLCGCGEKPNFHKGKYHLYISNHKNYIKPNDITINKIKNKLHDKNNIKNLLQLTNLNLSDLEKAYNSFIKLEKPMSVLSEELFIDFRTLKSYWLKLGLIENKDTFKRFTLKSKSKWMKLINEPNNSIKELLNNSTYLIKEYLIDKNKVTFDDILSLLNIKVDKNYLSWFLKQILNYDDIKKIKFIKESQLEINFLNVLKFYFGNSVNGSFELDGKIFDYKLGKKILIELDGDYWHSKHDVIENDLLKNEIAYINNYILIRVDDKEVKNLEFINKIKMLYEENK